MWNQTLPWYRSGIDAMHWMCRCFVSYYIPYQMESYFHQNRIYLLLCCKSLYSLLIARHACCPYNPSLVRPKSCSRQLNLNDSIRTIPLVFNFYRKCPIINWSIDLWFIYIWMKWIFIMWILGKESTFWRKNPLR